jgi:hypothetical protein
METTAQTDKAFPDRAGGGYWQPAAQEKFERDLEVFTRSLLEMIRQRPGIREAELRNMYTRRERMLVDEALLRLKSGSGITWKEDRDSTRLYLRRGRPAS